MCRGPLMQIACIACLHSGITLGLVQAGVHKCQVTDTSEAMHESLFLRRELQDTVPYFNLSTWYPGAMRAK